LCAAAGSLSLSVIAQDLTYDVEITGIDDGELLETASESSRLLGLEDRPPPSLASLRRRAAGDVERLNKVLRAHGFYSAAVRHEIDTKATPIVVKLIVDTGPAYLIRNVEIIFREPPTETAGMTFAASELGLESGTRAASSKIVAAEAELIAELERRSFPLARSADRKVVVDHATQTMDVTFIVAPGPFARFGAASVLGLRNVDELYVQRRLRWEPAQPYDRDLVERTRRALIESRLFSTVKIAHAEALDDEGLLPMTITVEEAKPRVLGAGVGYSTAEGLGFKAFWEHRNIFNKAERLRLELGGTRIRHGANAEFVKPDFLSRNQSLIANGSLTEERTDAFDSQSIATALSLERPLFELVTGRGGVGYERSFVSEDDVEERFTLVSLPLRFTRDSTDNLLDPTEGTRINLALTPYLRLLGSDLSFFVARLRPNAYFLLNEKQRLVLAAWGSVGTILGIDTEDLPADKRFYSGGGGSIRGYGFQLVGPLDSANDPMGGRSVLEAGLELRTKIAGDFGGVAFVEGGNVYDNGTPDLAEELFWGAGLGLRYFTGFGPVRLDLAFPLNRRNDVDDPFQIYVSLGQAF
jgi:translocation and assembly module TamA